ncbi:MAG: hypothetical protein Q7N50_04235 [Armatimonadota bacterium]|nr:hypothetical protein [Armatimonadota bacterium]
MKIICVGGASSHCGKTSTAAMLLKALPGWAAIKVTPSRHDEVCPLGEHCGACQPPEGPYEVITDKSLLAEPGTDTERLMAAGASGVAWVRALPQFLPEALESALAGLSTAQGVVIESTTAIPLLGGFNILVVKGSETRLKESAGKLAGFIDVLAINVAASELQQLSAMDSTAAILQARQTTTICAVLPPEHPKNRDFIQICREAVA